MKTKLMVLCSLLLALTACGATPHVQPGDGWISPLPRSAKGYELYSWRPVGQSQWHYALMSGTNRLKTAGEITSLEDVTTSAGPVKLSARSLAELEALLRRLPQGENVIWIDGGGQIGLPGQEVVQEVQDFCRRFGIELSVAARLLSDETGMVPLSPGSG